MATDELVTIAAGNLRLQLSPSIGGAISGFTWDGSRPILRESHSPLEKAVDAASFPLVPYVNRIRGGRFSFRGHEVRIAPNMAGDPSPLHGQGWINRWSFLTFIGSSKAASPLISFFDLPEYRSTFPVQGCRIAPICL